MIVSYMDQFSETLERISLKAKCPLCGGIAISNSAHTAFRCISCKHLFIKNKTRSPSDVVIICPKCKNAWYSDIPGTFGCDCNYEFSVDQNGSYVFFENIGDEENTESKFLDSGVEIESLNEEIFSDQREISIMSETFAQYLERWLKQSTSQGLNNPLVKMPVRRFRPLQDDEFKTLSNGGSLLLGTMSDPIARNLYKNFQLRIRERGERSAFICYGSIEMIIAAGVNQSPKMALFPICLKRALLQSTNEKVKVIVSDTENWQLNPVLMAHLNSFGIKIGNGFVSDPTQIMNFLKAQLGNRASQIRSDSYVGLFSSQQMVVQQRLTDPPLRQALAKNPVIKAKVENTTLDSTELGEITDDGIEELGLVLPCDDSQLRVIQLSNTGVSLQVEGPPGTGKSQTIANIISNALFHGRKALLVCDKKAAIIQVEERLTNSGLKPAILNLHDEDLDKREFLKQATEKFPATAAQTQINYPFEQLRETRKILNEKVNFGRQISHPSMPIPKRQALAGLIQLRKELKNIPRINIPNWPTLSKDRLSKILNSISEWPSIDSVLNDSNNIWNRAIVEQFRDNPNSVNELTALVERIAINLESIDEIREISASLGIHENLESDHSVSKVLKLTAAVLERPDCYPKLIGNDDLKQSELFILEEVWKKRESLISSRYPVVLTEIYNESALSQAKALTNRENVTSWEGLSNKQSEYINKYNYLKDCQDKYLRLCDQIGIIYSPLIKVRLAQLQNVLSLGGFNTLIPRYWWMSSDSPVLMVNGWISKLKNCHDIVKSSLLPLHFIPLERVSSTHWVHVDAMAEHGFNMVSYCTKFINDRKCKYALRQVYPNIPVRGFKQWREVTLQAVTAYAALMSLRSASEAHVILKSLSEIFLSSAHESKNGANEYIENDNVKNLQKTAALVEQCRERNDLYEISGVHWQTFWESPNKNVLVQVQSLLSQFNELNLPNDSSDNIESALKYLDQSSSDISNFIQAYETEGDRTKSILESFNAQKAYGQYQQQLTPLHKYIILQDQHSVPDWEWLKKIILWRDSFEKLRGQQKLDMDSNSWGILLNKLNDHELSMSNSYSELNKHFNDFLDGDFDYVSLRNILIQVMDNISNHPLWLEKRKWHMKITAYPEINDLWNRVIEGTVPSTDAERLFCFNLLHNCDPISNPKGAELKQTIQSFSKQDEMLTSWILNHLRWKLQKKIKESTSYDTRSEAELRRLSGLQRIRGTVRELVNSHIDYLLGAKPCWMMSPTSLANLVDSEIFRRKGIPFDLIIFDEASQIRVPDGLLSMSFGKQTIIVGDKNQLPPTDFFSSFGTSDAEESEIQDFGVSESLLDEFSGIFSDDKTHVMLMSHYRSETPDLIRFSNDWFYNGRLEMYPPSHISGIGRRLHYIPNAIYNAAGDRTNLAEAKEVVTLINAHVKEYPNKSLGVVTMNIPQMELIDSLIQDEEHNIRAFCNNEAMFFLRNLETVQGDEMDRIILSLTYGKNPEGRFNASFLGPLTKSGGERRLNVAITRSRSGMIVVTSLKMADLEASGAQSRGFQCVKAFISDLESSQKSNFGISNERFKKIKDGISNVVYCESPFEEQVVEYLENEGYEIECQYGAGKYRLDIVVKERGRNLLAIECDGARYHSSLVARTRDRARQRILERVGWRIHRVWSTNWWYYEQQEKESIIDAINSARITTMN
jgi:very-short-patch-repair endonuclease